VSVKNGGAIWRPVDFLLGVVTSLPGKIVSSFGPVTVFIRDTLGRDIIRSGGPVRVPESERGRMASIVAIGKVDNLSRALGVKMSCGIARAIFTPDGGCGYSADNGKREESVKERRDVHCENINGA
jgi:hypothetical protein